MNKQISLLVLGLFLTSLLVGCAGTATTVPTEVVLPISEAVQPTEVPVATMAASPTEAPVAPTAALPTKAPVASVPTLPATNATPTLLASIPENADDLQVISPELLKAMIEGGADIAIADAQATDSYAMGHIKGAVNVPWAMQLTSTGGLPMDKLIVVYCACSQDAAPSETDAGDVAMQMISTFGFSKVAVLDGGWLRWQELGYPTE